MNEIDSFIICLILFSFMPSLVEAKTADEWYNEGVYSGQTGKYNEAIIAYDEALKINPQYADAWYNKGLALANLNKHAKAIIAYDEAKKLQKAPGAEIIFAFVGLILITRLLKRKRL